MKKVLFGLIIILATWSGMSFAEEAETTTPETVEEAQPVEQVEAPKTDNRMRWTLINRRNKKNLNTRNFKEKYGKAGDQKEKTDRRTERRVHAGFGRRRVESKQKRNKTNWRINIKRYSLRGEGQTRRKDGATHSTRMEDRLKNRRVPYFQKRRYIENRTNIEK